MFKTCRASRKSIVHCLAFVLVLSATPIHAQQTSAPAEKPDPLKALQYRSIGPYRGGRWGGGSGVPLQAVVFFLRSAGCGRGLAAVVFLLRRDGRGVLEVG